MDALQGHNGLLWVNTRICKSGPSVQMQNDNFKSQISNTGLRVLKNVSSLSDFQYLGGLVLNKQQKLEVIMGRVRLSLGL